MRSSFGKYISFITFSLFRNVRSFFFPRMLGSAVWNLRKLTLSLCKSRCQSRSLVSSGVLRTGDVPSCVSCPVALTSQSLPLSPKTIERERKGEGNKKRPFIAFPFFFFCFLLTFLPAIPLLFFSFKKNLPCPPYLHHPALSPPPPPERALRSHRLFP